MAIKLVRANSDTPNIQNSDDSRLFRYACGGYDGVVKNYGNELNYEITGNNFKVKSGEFVIDGWQGDVDGNGVTIQVDNLGGIQYYVVYAEIDLSVSANQKAEIKAVYNTAYYPTISRGDDLTTTPSGVARLELYRFEASSGVISNVQKQFRVMDYGWCKNSENTNTINNLRIERDVNNVLKIGDITIPQIKVLWEGNAESVDISNLGIRDGDYLEIETTFETKQVIMVRPKSTEQTSWLTWVNGWNNYGLMLISCATLIYSLTNVRFNNANSVSNGIKTDNQNPKNQVMKNYTSLNEVYKITKITRIIR